MIGSVRYLAQAERHGTPLLVYDGSAVAVAVRDLRAALHPAIEIGYALTGSSNISVVGTLAGHGVGARVSSLVELRTATLANVDPRQVVYLGPGKSRAELDACVSAGIDAVVVDSFDELAELAGIAAARSVRQRVLLRVNPRSVSQDAWLTTAGAPRHLGIDEAQVLAAGRLQQRYPALDIVGVHGYLGTRVLDPDVVVEAVARNLEMAGRVAAATGIRLELVDVGGGLGAAYFEGEADPDLARLGRGMAEVVGDFHSRHPGTRLLFEAGSYLTARAGVYLVRVRYAKESMGERFAVVDGCTPYLASERPGTSCRGNVPVRLLNRPGEGEARPWRISGPPGTPDFMLTNVALPPLRPGDLLGFERCGTHRGTASPGVLPGHGFPAEVLVYRDEAYLVRDRDEPSDLLRKQQRHSRLTNGRVDRAQVVEHIRLIAAHLLGREVPPLRDDSTLTELGLCSSQVLEMLVDLERRVSFEVDADKLSSEVFVTVGSFTDYIMRMATDQRPPRTRGTAPAT